MTSGLDLTATLNLGGSREFNEDDYSRQRTKDQSIKKITYSFFTEGRLQFFIGIGYAFDEFHFIKLTPNSADSTKWDGKLRYPLAHIGARFYSPMYPDVFIGGRLSYGKGTMDFKRSGGRSIEINKIETYAFSGHVGKTFQFNSINTFLDVYGGADLNNSRVPKFNYEDQLFKSSDFKATFLFMLGMTLRR